MKIFICATRPRSLTVFRGPLIKAMIAEGHEVICCADGNDEEVMQSLSQIGVLYINVKVQRTNTNPFSDLVLVARLWWILRSHRPDLFLAYTAKPVIYGCIAARLAGISKAFALIEGLGYAFGDGPEFRRRLLRTVLTHFYRISLRFVNGVIFLNDADADDFVSRGIVSDPRKIHQIPGIGVDVQFYAFCPPLTSPVVFLMIARLLRDKGVQEFVSSSRTLKQDYPDIQCWLIGRLEDHPDAISREEIETWQEQGLVTYFGLVSDVRPYLKKCSVFVLPTFYREGLPRTILEAMAIGRPIITTDIPGCRLTVVPGKNGYLIPPRDTDALVRSMMRFISEPAAIDVFGRCSRKLVEDRFDVQSANENLLRILGLA